MRPITIAERMNFPHAQVQVDIVTHTLLPDGSEWVSWKWKLPAYLDGEWRTQRQISKGASSFRAMPGDYVHNMVENDMFVPWLMRKNASGMQGIEFLTMDELLVEQADHIEAGLWNLERVRKGAHARKLHKQTANRRLQPYSWQQWINTARVEHLPHLVALRSDEGADDHFHLFVDVLMEKLAASRPLPRLWHLPYIIHEEYEDFIEHNAFQLALASATRCRRASYFRLDRPGVAPNLHDDIIKAREMLAEKPMHATPFEHQVTFEQGGEGFPHLAGNFSNYYHTGPEKGHPILDGIVQFRKMLVGEYTLPLAKAAP